MTEGRNITSPVYSTPVMTGGQTTVGARIFFLLHGRDSRKKCHSRGIHFKNDSRNYDLEWYLWIFALCAVLRYKNIINR